MKRVQNRKSGPETGQGLPSSYRVGAGEGKSGAGPLWSPVWSHFTPLDPCLASSIERSSSLHGIDPYDRPGGAGGPGGAGSHLVQQFMMKNRNQRIGQGQHLLKLPPLLLEWHSPFTPMRKQVLLESRPFTACQLTQMETNQRG